MYCPNCGADAPQNLRYCKRCGASLYSSAELAGTIAPRQRLTGAVWALALATIIVGLGGLGIVFGVVGDLAGRTNIGKGLLVPMVVLGSVTVLGIVAMLIRLISRLLTEGDRGKAYQQPARLPRMAGSQDYIQPQIVSPPRVVGSVTDQTTRNFDPSIPDQTRR